jgi:hypothetical protein
MPFSSGEVYLGTDTRHVRSVAIKVSSRKFNDRFASTYGAKGAAAGMT